MCAGVPGWTCAARIVVSGNDSDRELFLRLDPDSGDLCITPSGQSARRGLVSVRWNIAFRREADLILPCVNGLLVQASREHPASRRFPWPFEWNAQLVIAQREGCCLMLHSQDTAWKFKALNLHRQDGLTCLGLESEQVGPLWDNRNAGGVEWRLNVYAGDWRVPADRYRAWLHRTYRLEEKRAARPDWVDHIDFSLQWAHPDPAVLEALARIHPPERTLIHLSDWRTSKYDVDYPDYIPRQEARDYLARANALGFRVMPHFNYFACYEGHPLYPRLRPWQLRSPYANEPQGWYYPFDTHDYTRMGYIHPGLTLWRRTLEAAVLDAVATLDAPAAFLDQTLCTWNTDNGLVENMTTVEGMYRLHEELAAIRPDLVLAGEGLNEVSFQWQCFAQAHIHDGWLPQLEPRHVDAAHGICAYLWRGHTRLVGYYHLDPEAADVDLGIEVYRRMGAIPTLICRAAGEKALALITPQQPAVRRLLELAENSGP